jgi:DNA polymerase-3 subunit delta'
VSTDWAVIGHDWAVKRLQAALARNALAQSHLFVGAQSIGKTTLALALAGAVLERGARDVPRVRKLVRELRHPDLNLLRAEGESIKVEQVRGMLHVLSLAPVESEYRVVIIDRADLMTDAGKNAILKTLEEPNPRVIMVLTAPSVESVLPTISSRCAITILRAAAQPAIRAALEARGIAPALAEVLARASRGRVGHALAAAGQDVADEQSTVEFARLLGTTRTERFAFAEKLAKQREGIDTVLESWMRFSRDALATCATEPAVAFRHMQAIARARRRLDRNVNPRLTLDVMMLELGHA